MNMTGKPMTEPQSTAFDCIFENVLGFMLPFFLASALGNPNHARAAIKELVQAYKVATASELELVGRILGFSVVAMDNLRLSMNPGMSDTKILRYRSNAVALSRAGEQCRKILEAIQNNQDATPKSKTIPAPTIVPAPAPNAKAQPVPSVQPTVPSASLQSAPPQSVPTQSASPQSTPTQSPSPQSPSPRSIEAMKQDARALLTEFVKNSDKPAAPAWPFPHLPDPATTVGAAVKQAFANARRNAAA
jgi:hypothetical protein